MTTLTSGIYPSIVLIALSEFVTLIFKTNATFDIIDR